MPARKSNASVGSNGAEDGAETTPAKAAKDGLSVEDLSLPKSMIARLAKGVLPANTQIQKDALLALHKSATVFVSYIASTSNENTQSSGKKTISPQDVMAAMKECEFEDFLPRLEAELKKYNETQCDKRNTYRRKVKEEKAAAAVKESGEEAPKEGETTEGANGTMNGHAETEDENGDRPVKKLKAEDGSALAPHDDSLEEDDDLDPDEDIRQVDNDSQLDPFDEDEADDEDADDDQEEDNENEPVVLVDADNVAASGDLRDEALDDPDSDSD